MAQSSRRIQILHALEDLTSDQLSRFTAQMREKRGDGVKPDNFRMGQVEGKTILQLTDLLVGSLAAHAVQVTVALLRAIDCNDVANNLEEDAKDLLPPSKPSSNGVPGAPAPPGGECDAPAPGGESDAPARARFVDKHRRTLIERVSNVASILDRLLDEGVLKQGQYEEAMSSKTKQDQMRFLFNGPLKAGGDRSKDIFLSALEKEEAFLIEELREGDA